MKAHSPLLTALLLASLLPLASCLSKAPQPRLFVLEPMPTEKAVPAAQGLPPLQLLKLELPGYLATSSMILRKNAEVQTLDGALWAEPLPALALAQIQREFHLAGRGEASCPPPGGATPPDAVQLVLRLHDFSIGFDGQALADGVLLSRYQGKVRCRPVTVSTPPDDGKLTPELFVRQCRQLCHLLAIELMQTSPAK